MMGWVACAQPTEILASVVPCLEGHRYYACVTAMKHARACHRSWLIPGRGSDIRKWWEPFTAYGTGAFRNQIVDGNGW